MFSYLIVGAGPSGLCAAKTILECEPDADLRILDANKTVGGVWATENLYPGLKTNNLRGGIDFSDFPMDDSFGVAAGEHVTGEAMHEYLRAYAERSNLGHLIDFETSVQEISPLEGQQGWNLKVQTNSGAAGMAVTLQTKKLIIATGITNVPHRPLLIGSTTFDGPIIHSAELGANASFVHEDGPFKKIAVIGGGKSAFDAVFIAGKAYKTVQWIMRKSGKGPEWIFPAHTKIGPFKFVRERLATRRIISCFSPCLWEDGMGWIRHFLHFTNKGKQITQKFWANLYKQTLAQCNMLSHPYTAALEPETSPFWYGTASGVYSYDPTIYGMVADGQISIYREDISYLSKHSIILANGTTVRADAIITATGFSAKPTIRFTPSKLHSDLGIPSDFLAPEQHEFWNALNNKADATIAAKFPQLIAGPTITSSGSSSAAARDCRNYNPSIDRDLSNRTPWRLYRGIAPPGLTAQGERTIVFVGMFSNLANTPRCELQCLWAYAYLNGYLDNKDNNKTSRKGNGKAKAKANGAAGGGGVTGSGATGNTVAGGMIGDFEAIFEDTALMSRYAKHRAPYGHGNAFPDLVFDQLPYMDLLLQDLGLKYWRKSNWLSELFGSYVSSDYAGVVQEWIRARDLNNTNKTD
ncbi:FAD-dependent monooxygenase DEP4 [Exophiala dermatitidis]